jgi:hypothetical protein
MDVLDSDPTLNVGYRETIRTIYARFAPAVKKAASVEIAAGLTVKDVLDSDPNLNRGQRETIRAVLAKIKPKT